MNESAREIRAFSTASSSPVVVRLPLVRREAAVGELLLPPSQRGISHIRSPATESNRLKVKLFVDPAARSESLNQIESPVLGYCFGQYPHEMALHAHAEKKKGKRVLATPLLLSRLSLRPHCAKAQDTTRNFPGRKRQSRFEVREGKRHERGDERETQKGKERERERMGGGGFLLE